jgi:hypothetical protein
MAFRFQKSSCIVVGTFNMYILHPKWLAKHGIIESGVEVAIETNFTQPGFRFTFPKLDIRWLIAPNRVIVESSKPAVDCGAIVAKMLKALPETPLQGLGSNVDYEAELNEIEKLSRTIRDFPQQTSPNAGESIAQRTFHVAVKRGEHEATNLQLSFTETKIELACNVHVGLENRENANEAAIAAASRYFEDRARSDALARYFFGTEVSQ